MRQNQWNITFQTWLSNEAKQAQKNGSVLTVIWNKDVQQNDSKRVWFWNGRTPVMTHSSHDCREKALFVVCLGHGCDMGHLPWTSLSLYLSIYLASIQTSGLTEQRWRFRRTAYTEGGWLSILKEAGCLYWRRLAAYVREGLLPILEKAGCLYWRRLAAYTGGGWLPILEKAGFLYWRRLAAYTGGGWLSILEEAGCLFWRRLAVYTGGGWLPMLEKAGCLC